MISNIWDFQHNFIGGNGKYTDWHKLSRGYVFDGFALSLVYRSISWFFYPVWSKYNFSLANHDILDILIHNALQQKAAAWLLSYNAQYLYAWYGVLHFINEQYKSNYMCKYIDIKYNNYEIEAQ